MVKVSNISVVEETIEETKELKEIFALMARSGYENPREMLPSTPWHTVSFELHDTFAGFANGIRRMLVEELPCKGLDFEEKALITDDDFILNDVIRKNVNLIPIRQEISKDEFNTSYSISLTVYNPTNEIMDVKASHIKVTTNKGKELPVEKLIPNSNIIIIRLRPNKTVTINKITVIEDRCKNNAATSTLLNNVKYTILDMVPYDIHTGAGVRSIEYDPKSFSLSFTTASNIQPKTVVKMLCDDLRERLGKIHEHIAEYSKSDLTKKYYYSEFMEVSIKDDINTYKFVGEYYTLANMISQKCYLLDEIIQFISPSVDRFDNEIAIIRITHADPNKILLKSIDSCLSDIGVLEKSLLEHV